MGNSQWLIFFSWPWPCCCGIYPPFCGPQPTPLGLFASPAEFLYSSLHFTCFFKPRPHFWGFTSLKPSKCFPWKELWCPYLKLENYPPLPNQGLGALSLLAFKAKRRNISYKVHHVHPCKTMLFNASTTFPWKLTHSSWWWGHSVCITLSYLPLPCCTWLRSITDCNLMFSKSESFRRALWNPVCKKHLLSARNESKCYIKRNPRQTCSLTSWSTQLRWAQISRLSALIWNAVWTQKHRRVESSHEWLAKVSWRRQCLKWSKIYLRKREENKF